MDGQAVLVRQHALQAYDPGVYDGPKELYDEMLSKKYLSASIGATFAWFLNHYRWIVWKLASMELTFPLLLLDKYLTRDQVMYQVHRRYQKDLCSVQRSILKKVLNRDASPVSCMVLCIAAVIPFPVDQEKQVDLALPEYWNLGLVLTDGWYSVYGVADLALSSAIWKAHKQQGLVGSKIVVWNAQLQNSTDGVDPLECAVASEPWKHPMLEKEEPSRCPYLKLQFNSTRRVEFATPLGLEQVAAPSKSSGAAGSRSKMSDERSVLGFQMLKSVPMRSLDVGGGMVRAVRVLIMRISPVLHLQSKDHTLGPRILCEEHMELHHEARTEQLRLRSGSNEDDNDQALEGYGGLDWLDAPLPTPFVKLDVLCTHELCAIEERRQPMCFGVLTMWRPSPDLLAGGLLEGREYYASNLSVNWKIDSGPRGVFLRLSTTKGSRFELTADESADKEESEPRSTRLSQLVGATQSRACVSISDAMAQQRSAAEDGTASSERKLVVDVCVYVLQASEATPLEDAAKKNEKDNNASAAPADSSNVKIEQQSFVEHAFATDASSSRIMSIRLSSTAVSISSTAASSKRRSSTSKRPTSFVFRRGNRNVWKEGSVVCISGLEVSHYDEQLGVLDCSLVESSQITTHPSKKSHFFEPFQALKNRSAKTASGADAAAFRDEVVKLRKYVDRRILQMEFVPTQNEEEEEEAERLTQDFTAHELCVVEEPKPAAPLEPKFVAWDASITRLLAMPDSNSGFPQEIVALAILELHLAAEAEAQDRREALSKTVYFTRALAVAFLQLLSAAVGGVHEPVDQLSDGEVVDCVLRCLEDLSDNDRVGGGGGGGSALSKTGFHVEARRETNERLVNSCFDWERLHASYLCVERISFTSGAA